MRLKGSWLYLRVMLAAKHSLHADEIPKRILYAASERLYTSVLTVIYRWKAFNTLQNSIKVEPSSMVPIMYCNFEFDVHGRCASAGTVAFALN